MKRSALIILCVLVLLAVVFIVTSTFRQREPVYQGKSLSEWIREASAGSWPRQSTVADKAIRQIGTNAFPIISQLLRSHDSSLKLKLIKLYYRQSFVRISISTQSDHERQAIAACYALGPIAKPLVPEVAKALPTMYNQPFAEQWLGSLGPDAAAAIPALVALLRDKDPSKPRAMALQNLAHISIDRREEVLPVLNEYLKDSNQSVRHEAGLALKILERTVKTETGPRSAPRGAF